MAHDVFISHAHRDKGIADEICEKLELARLRCWIAPRDISARDDWTEATRKAIESSRVMVVVFTDNANAAPHIERELAQAFYTGKMIVAFRLTEALPRRDFLFYLGDACWLDAFNSPPERQLEALTTRIENVTPPPNAAKTTAPPNILNSGKGDLVISHRPNQGVFKLVAIAALVAAAVPFALWFAWQPENRDQPMADINLRPKYSGPGASSDSSSEVEGTKLESTPRYAYTRLGLWVPVNPSPTPFIQRETQGALTSLAQSASATPSPSPNLDQKAGSQPGALPTASGLTVKPALEDRAQVIDRHAGHRGKSRTKRHIARNDASEGSRFARIKNWLSGLFQ
jgi:hypothetical protein